MTEAPERDLWPKSLWIDGRLNTIADVPVKYHQRYVRADVHESERALNKELVEALKDIRATLQDGAGENLDGTWWSHARQIDAALARAEEREKD